MTLYIPDQKYIDGKKFLEELPGEKGDAIRYYVSENEKYAKQTSDRLSELIGALRVIKNFIK